MIKDYYIILGVKSTASQNEIKAAYRRQVKELHPDHYGKDTGPFLDVQEAYSILGDPIRRKAYDRSIVHTQQPVRPQHRRTEPLRTKPPVEPLIPGKNEPDLGDISLERSFLTFTPSFEELFDRLWSNFTGLTRPKAERIEGLNVEITITPEQALTGGRARIMIPARRVCPYCHGRGAVGFFECWSCEGTGAVADEYPVEISFTAGLTRDYILEIPLDRYGIDNFYLKVFFRISEEE